MRPFATLELHGPAGEPVDLRRTLLSHGVAALPPAVVDAAGDVLTVTLTATHGPRTITVSAAARSSEKAPTSGAQHGRHDGPAVALLAVADAGPPPDADEAAALIATTRRMLCLDDDLGAFYGRAAGDPDLAWACAGAGRMLRGQTVFEDLVKTVCTTNCAWSATERMAGALVEHLGAPAPGAPPSGPCGRAFPGAARMAEADEGFYRDVARAGYRGPRLRAIAAAVAAGALDLERLLTASPAELSDDEAERRLLELPGVGPYAAAHVMMLVGRHSRLVLDSWTRPNYARLVGKPAGTLVADRTIGRRFGAYGAHAGLAFWLFVTRDWVETPRARSGRPPAAPVRRAHGC